MSIWPGSRAFGGGRLCVQRPAHDGLSARPVPLVYEMLRQLSQISRLKNQQNTASPFWIGHKRREGSECNAKRTRCVPLFHWETLRIGKMAKKRPGSSRLNPYLFMRVSTLYLSLDCRIIALGRKSLQCFDLSLYPLVNNNFDSMAKRQWILPSRKNPFLKRMTQKYTFWCRL